METAQAPRVRPEGAFFEWQTADQDVQETPGADAEEEDARHPDDFGEWEAHAARIASAASDGDRSATPTSTSAHARYRGSRTATRSRTSAGPPPARAGRRAAVVGSSRMRAQSVAASADSQATKPVRRKRSRFASGSPTPPPGGLTAWGRRASSPRIADSLSRNPASSSPAKISLMLLSYRSSRQASASTNAQPSRSARSRPIVVFPEPR